MESRFEVRTYIVKYFCDPCSKKGGGEYIFTGRTMLTSPPKYEHRCNRCDARGMFVKQYPSTELEEMSNEY